MNVIPYINFDGKCDEALDFYKKALGAQVDFLMRNDEAPEKPVMPMAPDSAKKVLHVSFRVGDTIIQGSDGYAGGKPDFQGFTLSINVKDTAEAERVFKSLTADGGKVNMPLTKTFFSPAFGMCLDKLGMPWMVYVPQAMPAHP